MSRAAADTTSFVLTGIDVYDWGAFGGRHSADIDIRGTAIIGPTGSGKTTLVDALMTLLTFNPRYNLASTGGHESDRDLVSYVRGVSGPGNDSGGNEHVARSGNVVSGIAARFSDGADAIRIGALFWIEGSSAAPADLKRRWFFCLGDETDLDVWLQAHRAGGARALKQMERDAAGVKIYEDKTSYLARLRSYFDVGENAFNLLNRAAGLKQLNSIDEVFRDLVLDDTSRFDRASEVADEFNTLDGIHAELQIARRQRDALLPIEREWTTRAQCELELHEQRDLAKLLTRWYAAQARRHFAERGAVLRSEHAAAKRESEQLDVRIAEADARAQSLHSDYLQAGGAGVIELERLCALQHAEADRRLVSASEYQAWIRLRGWDPTLDQACFESNRQLAQQWCDDARSEHDALKQRAFERGARRQRSQEALQTLIEMLKDVEASPHSNIPPEYGRFRANLAAHLAVAPEELPFVAELVEVAANEQRWRGAIERAIGAHRLRILAEPGRVDAALRWIDARDNRLHVRLHEAEPPRERIQFFADGYTRKLNFKAHPLREPLKLLLSKIDRHCVAAAEDLRTVAHALTDRGLMSGRQGYFDKQDQRPLDADWMTGFDNRDRHAELVRQIAEARLELEADRKEAESVQRQVEVLDGALLIGTRLLELRFEQIDAPGAERELEDLLAKLARLTAPDSEADAARRRWEDARQVVGVLRDDKQRAERRAVDTESRLRRCEESQLRAAERAGGALTDAQAALAGRFHQPLAVDVLDRWEDAERAASGACLGRIEQLVGKLSDLDKQLVRLMGKAKAVDTGSLAESGSEIQDVPAYLERLRVLVEEALPERQQAFVSYLNQSSTQGVTQLLSDMDNEVATIEERIAELNGTLERVDFQPDRFLRLVPQRIVHDSLRTLDQAQRALRAAMLKDDQGESHYTALRYVIGLLRDAVDKRKTLAARALLDPRHRLRFAVSVIDRDTRAVIETRTSSQGGSGGEKEIIASYVLTASLSYALSPVAREHPLFSSIVLDEAFSKSSHAVAGRIIRALEEFGLHPLFVTPNKELRLLRQHTRSAILIHRKGRQATMTSLSWEALEAHARQRTAGLA